MFHHTHNDHIELVENALYQSLPPTTDYEFRRFRELVKEGLDRGIYQRDNIEYAVKFSKLLIKLFSLGKKDREKCFEKEWKKHELDYSTLTMIDLDSRELDPLSTEDLYFCKKAKEQGFQIFVSSEIKLSHIGLLKVKADGSVTTLEI